MTADFYEGMENGGDSLAAERSATASESTLSQELIKISQQSVDPTADEARQKSDHEKAKLQSLFEKYPEDDQHHVEIESGLDVVVCGTEPNQEHIKILERAMQVLEAKFGKEVIEKAFNGVTTYLVVDVGAIGGGQALPREGAVILSAEHMGMKVSDMEELASRNGMYRKGDQSEVFGAEADASEIGFVHELGHILEYRAHGDMGAGFRSLDQAEAPTWYGQVKGAHEDYAESWMFLAYGHDEKLSEERREILLQDLGQAAARQ